MNKKTDVKNDGIKRFISRNELAKRWSVSTMTIRRREWDGTLNAYIFGRDIRFLISDIEQVEEKAKVK